MTVHGHWSVGVCDNDQPTKNAECDEHTPHCGFSFSEPIDL